MHWIPMRMVSQRVLYLVIVVSCGLIPTSRSRAAVEDIEDPAIRRVAQKGADYLRRKMSLAQPGMIGLPTYALLKAGEPPDSMLITAAIAVIKKKIRDGKYIPRTYHNYEAGIDLMALEAADPIAHFDDIQLMADYLIERQKPYGAWDYLTVEHNGDTSISQYAVLGLWAAKRAGVHVPLRAWDGAAAWHVKVQDPNGGFGYQPASGHKTTTHSMGVAGVGSLYVVRMMMANHMPEPAVKQQAKKKTGRPFGVLESVDAPPPPEKTKSETSRPSRKSDASYRPRTGRSSIDRSLSDGDNWISENFTIGKPSGWPIYYLYGLERYGALSGFDQIDGLDWYEEGCKHLASIQRPEGYWRGHAASTESTSFALLFLTKATAKLVNRAPRSRPQKLGGGLLAGGRGLPDDLSLAKTKDGKVTSQKVVTPLDRLLADLAKSQGDDIGATQTNLVKAVQIGNREELIGQKEQLIELVKDPRPEVQRTALWALGRCEDLRLAPMMIQALRGKNIDIMIEARNALCVLSQRPNGFNRYRKVTLRVKRDGTQVANRILFRGQEKSDVLTYELYLSQLKLREGDQVTFLVESDDGSGDPLNVKQSRSVKIQVFDAASTALVKARLDADIEQLKSKQLKSSSLVEIATADDKLTSWTNGIIPIRIKARNPEAFPDNPLEHLPADATADERADTVKKWQDEMVRRWTAWYLDVRPYDERDELGKR